MACTSTSCKDPAQACADSASEELGTTSADALACNASTIDKVVNQSGGSVKNRLGNNLSSIKQLESNYLLTAVNGGVWASGQTFTAYNQYMVFSGVAYKPQFSTSLPYVVGATPDTNFVEPVANLTVNQGDQRYPRDFDTLADASSNPEALENTSAIVAERTSGNGGGATWDYVTGETANGFDIVDHDTIVGLQLKLRKDTYTLPPELGAEGDGATDDLTKIDRFVETAENRTDKDYKTSATIISDRTDFILSEIKLSPDAFGGFSLDFSSPVVLNTTTTSKCFTWVNSVDFADVTGLTPGMVVKIISADAWPFWVGVFYGQTGTIAEISGSTVTFEEPFYMSIESGATVTVYAGGSLILDRNLVRNAVAGVGVNSNCIRVLGYRHVEIENAVLENGQSKGVFLAYCTNVNICGGEFRASNATTTGYGVQTWGCNNVTISDIKGWGNRRLIDISGDIPTVAATVQGFHVHGGGKQEDGSAYYPIGGVVNSGGGSHGGAITTNYRDGIITNVAEGLNLRGVKQSITNITFDGAIGTELIKLTDGADCFIDGVIYRPYGAGYNQDTIASPTSLIANDFVSINAAFAAAGGKLSIKNTDVVVQDAFVKTAGTMTGRVELMNASCRFEKEGGGNSNWFEGDFDEISVDNKTVEVVSGTRALLAPNAATLSPGKIDQTEDYRLDVADEGAEFIEINTASTQIVVTVLSRTNADVRGIILVRDGSATLRDLGTSNLLDVASGALAPGGGSLGNVTLSLSAGTLYAANRTGASIVLSLNVQGSE